MLASLLFASAAAASAANVSSDLRPLPPGCGTAVTSVAWISDAELLLSSVDRGVVRYSLRTRSCAPILAATPPAGVASAFRVATDGGIAVASGLPAGQVAVRLSDGARLFGRQTADLLVSDIAVRANSIFLLGYPVKDTKPQLPSTAVWRANISADWSALTPVHRLTTAESLEIFRYSVPGYTGAIAIEQDGTLDVITAAEPGVFRYKPDGTLLEHRGSALRELIVERMPEMFLRYAKDEEGRFRSILNQQPTIDDLVATTDGPAIVVRIAEDDTIRWELWYPNAIGTATRVRLDVHRRGPFGTMRCDARARRLACVLDAPPERGGPGLGKPSLLLFALRKP